MFDYVREEQAIRINRAVEDRGAKFQHEMERRRSM